MSTRMTNVCSSAGCTRTETVYCHDCTRTYCSVQCHVAKDTVTGGGEKTEPAVFDIEGVTVANTRDIRVIYADQNVELAVESVNPNDSVPYEVHENSTQLIRVERGSANVYLKTSGVEQRYELAADSNSLLMIPQGTWHKVVAGPAGVKFYTTYSPPRNQQ